MGYKLYLVVSDSMTPELNVGDMILSKNPSGQTLKEGDVVTFEGQSGAQKGKLITHKIVIPPYEGEDGNIYIRTQGVKENAPLDDPIRVEYVRGVMVKKLAFTGFILKLIMKPAGFLLIIALPLMLIIIYQLYRLAMFNIKRKERV